MKFVFVVRQQIDYDEYDTSTQVWIFSTEQNATDFEQSLNHRGFISTTKVEVDSIEGSVE